MINKIFLDMDGVIVNFRGQCEKYECINGNKVNWEVVHQGGPEFWEEMEWLPEGKELYEWILKLCEQENIDLFIINITLLLLILVKKKNIMLMKIPF